MSNKIIVRSHDWYNLPIQLMASEFVFIWQPLIPISLVYSWLSIWPVVTGSNCSSSFKNPTKRLESIHLIPITIADASIRKFGLFCFVMHIFSFHQPQISCLKQIRWSSMAWPVTLARPQFFRLLHIWYRFGKSKIFWILLRIVNDSSKRVSDFNR